jgi:formate hydrogenlyase subunit 6/NADH:ubiquinone oxidoreductase subunit I
MKRPGVILCEALRNAFSRKKATIDYPFKDGVKPKEGLRGAHRFEIDKCIGCGICSRVCPTGAIDMVPSERTRTKKRPVIDLGECIFCALCAERCPKDCLHMTDYIELSAFEPEKMIIYKTEPEKETEGSDDDSSTEETNNATNENGDN